MAKKKSSHQAAQDHNLPQKTQIHDQKPDFPSSKLIARQPSMEDLQNLKSLNSLLLKETFERRQQIETQEQVKEELESELTRFGDERKELEAEMVRAGERNVGLELEKCVVFVYVVAQMGEMGINVDRLVKEKKEKEVEVVLLRSEVKGLMGGLEQEKTMLNRVLEERDLAKSDLDVQIKEMMGLKGRMIEMEEKDVKIGAEMLKVKGEFEKLMKEKEGQGKDMRQVVKERDLMRDDLKYAAKEVEGLKRKIVDITREKEEIKKEKSSQGVKIDKLESDIEKQKGVVMSLRKEEEELRTRVLELENSYGEAMEREAGRATEIGVLLKEKCEMERTIEKLMDDKKSVSQNLEMLMVESDEKQKKVERLMEENGESRNALEMNMKQIKEGEEKIEQLLREKSEVEGVKVSLESENVEFKRDLSKLQDFVSRLEESCRDFKEKNKALDSEVGHLKNAFDQVKQEKDDVLKSLVLEKESGKKLKSEVMEMERKIKKFEGEMAQTGSEKESLIKEKEEIETRYQSLSTEKSGLQKGLSESNKSIDDLKANLDSTRINYERVRSVLKYTASLVCQSPVHNDRDAKQEEDKVEPYSAELEAIKKAFRDKETIVQDMKREAELMRNSVAEAEKRKNFWTIVSSLTTIIAAACVAYAVRLR